MKSEDEMMEKSDNAGEGPRWGDDVEGVNMSGDGVERRAGGTKGRESGCVGKGDGACKAGSAAGGGIRLGLAFGLREVVNGEVFGRGGSFSLVMMTNGEFGMGDVSSDEPDRVDGAKRTPYGRTGDAELGFCSWGWGGDRARESVLCSRGTWDRASRVCARGKAGEYGAIS